MIKDIQLCVTVRWKDTDDHLSEKTETIVVKDIVSIDQGHLYAGILIGLLGKWEQESTKVGGSKTWNTE